MARRGPAWSTLAARLSCDNTVSMKRQSVLTRKKRGPPPTGKGELIGVRIQPDQMAALDDWIDEQEDDPSRPEAIRRLVELGLATAQRAGARIKKSSEMAGEE